MMAIATAAVALSACGSSASAPLPSGSSSNVLSAAEINHYPAGSVERTFLSYWSALQFQTWADVAAYYDPRFRAYLGTAQVISAKKQNSSTFPMLKPEIVSVTTHGGETAIHYALRFPEGSKEQASISWQKEGGNWQIVYDSRLDAELSQLAQNRVEIRKNRALPTDPSKRSSAAVRAGNVASQIQARFLQQDLHNSHP